MILILSEYISLYIYHKYKMSGVKVCNCDFCENLLNSEPNGKLQLWYGKDRNGKSRLLEKLLEKTGEGNYTHVPLDSIKYYPEIFDNKNKLKKLYVIHDSFTEMGEIDAVIETFLAFKEHMDKCFGDQKNNTIYVLMSNDLPTNINNQNIEIRTFPHVFLT